jgi:spore maturation protein CgeB
MILCVLRQYELWLETVDILRQNCDALIVNWSTDDSWKYEQFSTLIAPAFDVLATTSKDAFEKSKRDGHGNFVLTQWAANADSLAEPLPAVECRYPASFVGSAYGNRPAWIAALRKRGIEVACFGHGWPAGPVAAADIPRIMRESVVSLNFGDSGLVMQGLRPVRSRQIKARVFEVPGAGGFLLTERADGLEDHYVPNKEIVIFESAEDLAAKIRYFQAHPEERDRIARAGFERTRREHTYDARFASLFAATRELALHSRASTSSAKTCCFDFAEFDRVAARHRLGFGLNILKYALLVPCILVWGRQRGPRAARRIVFELSWRLAGRKTYTASGCPGRMFYRES